MDAIKILGSLLSSGALGKGGSNDLLGNILGAALGGSQDQPTRGGGGLGDLLGSVLGGGSGSSGSAGGLGDLLGSMLGGSGSSGSAGGLDELLKGGLGGLLGGAVAKHAQTVDPNAPTPMPDDYDMLPRDLEPQQANEQATILIRAMINAAKSDGHIDEAEQQAILAKLGDITQDEIDFIRQEFAKPLDVEAFVNDVPRGMEHQIYLLSLAAIDLDKQSEANYLGQLAQALRISPDEANAIHEQLGAPKIFAA